MKYDVTQVTMNEVKIFLGGIRRRGSSVGPGREFKYLLRRENLNLLFLSI